MELEALTLGKLVLLIHGIRTRAWWQGPLKALIERQTGATVIPLKYGYFDLLRFWCPLRVCREGPASRLHQELRAVIYEFPGQEISVIAHSYGTSIIARLLLEHRDIKLSKLILCGSVIPNDYPWSRVATQFLRSPMRLSVINDCGTKDIWPPLASSTSWGYGSSGTHGFGSAQITDRIHAMPHSGYLNKSFAQKFWVPFLKDGTITLSTVERAGVGSPWWFTLLDLPWRWAIVAVLLASLASGLSVSSIFWRGSSEFSQNMNITGNSNIGTQIINKTTPTSAEKFERNPPQVEGERNVIIQERIK